LNAFTLATFDDFLDLAELIDRDAYDDLIDDMGMEKTFYVLIISEDLDTGRFTCKVLGSRFNDSDDVQTPSDIILHNLDKVACLIPISYE